MSTQVGRDLVDAPVATRGVLRERLRDDDLEVPAQVPRVHWIDAAGATVGQGAGTNSSSIEIEESRTSSHERTYSVEYGGGFSIGFLNFSGSYPILDSGSTSTLYSVTLTDTTTYGGTVGDIGGAHWDDWHYDFGVAVYHRGVPLDPTQPGGEETPLQVITFWTEPSGAAYR